MTAATLTLTSFLLARIAEDEAEVTRLVAHYPHSADEQGWCGNMDDVDVRVGLGRALAECAAKRAIVREHAVGDPYAGAEDALWCRRCEDRSIHDAHAWPCPTLRHLAAVYADHPDYRDEWRP